MNKLRITGIILVSVLGVACGSGITTYEEGLQAEWDIMDEMAGVLAGVHDDASAQAAADEIRTMGRRMAEITARMQKLPAPGSGKMQDITKTQLERQRAFSSKATPLMVKFTQYPALGNAWLNAMKNAMGPAKR